MSITKKSKRRKFLFYYPNTRHPMELYHEIKDDVYVLILAGTLDGDNAAELNITLQKALKSAKSNILIDCRQLQYLSSAGMGIFLSNLPAIREQHKELIFYGLNPANRQMFKVLGLEGLLKIFDKLPAALQD